MNVDYSGLLAGYHTLATITILICSVHYHCDGSVNNAYNSNYDYNIDVNKVCQLFTNEQPRRMECASLLFNN